MPAFTPRPIIAAFFLLVQSLSAQDMIWTNPVPVADKSFGFSRPRVVVNGQDEPIFLWSNEASHKIYINRYVQGQMTPPVQINPPGTSFFGATWAGPELAASGQDVYVVGKEQPEDETGVSLFHSGDGGSTFSELNNIDWATGDDLSRFPGVAAGSNGEVWVAYMRFAPDFSEPRYVVSKSMDKGQTFLADVNASSSFINGEACDCCAAQLARSDNKLAMIFRNNDQNIRTIWAGISQDGGNSFDAGFEIDQTGSYFASCPATAPDGYWEGNRLISTFRAAPGGRERVFFSVFDLDSQKVVLHQYLTNSPDQLLAQNHPRITGNQDTVFLIWEESYAGNLDIKFRLSTTGPEGLVTAETKVLNQSTSGNQLRPDVHWENGRLHVVYQDVVTNQVIYISGKVDAVSPLNGVTKSTRVHLFPNPTSRFILISSPIDFDQVVLFDHLGQAVKNQNVMFSNREIDLSNLSQGIYTIQLKNTTSGSEYSERIVLHD